MAALAEAPLRRRALERKGMTPEEELDLLIREQTADDTHFVARNPRDISLDTTSPNGDLSLADLIGVNEDGEVVVFDVRATNGRRRPMGQRGSLCDLSQVPHGTLGGYNNHKCRCVKCRAAVCEYRRKQRQS